MIHAAVQANKRHCATSSKRNSKRKPSLNGGSAIFLVALSREDSPVPSREETSLAPISHCFSHEKIELDDELDELELLSPVLFAISRVTSNSITFPRSPLPLPSCPPVPWDRSVNSLEADSGRRSTGLIRRIARASQRGLVSRPRSTHFRKLECRASCISSLEDNAGRRNDASANGTRGRRAIARGFMLIHDSCTRGVRDAAR